MSQYYDDGPAWDDEDESGGWLPDAPEWEPNAGECDRCADPDGPPVGPLGLVCACRIGQGAAPEDCQCGPQQDDEGAS